MNILGVGNGLRSPVLQKTCGGITAHQVFSPPLGTSFLDQNIPDSPLEVHGASGIPRTSHHPPALHLWCLGNCWISYQNLRQNRKIDLGIQPSEYYDYTTRRRCIYGVQGIVGYRIKTFDKKNIDLLNTNIGILRYSFPSFLASKVTVAFAIFSPRKSYQIKHRIYFDV